MNIDPKVFKIKTKDDRITELKYNPGKHSYEECLKSLKIDGECYRKNYKSVNKKKVFMIVSEILIASVGLGVGTGLTISGLAPVGFMCVSSISLHLVSQH